MSHAIRHAALKMMNMYIELTNFFQPALLKVKELLQQLDHLKPLHIFLRHELDRIQRVISLVRATLSDLKLAIDGTIVMSENLRDALDNIYDARIPAMWKKVTYT